jgi:hypothetical protein
MVPQAEFLPDDWPKSELTAYPNFAEILESLTEFQPQNYSLPSFSE